IDVQKVYGIVQKYYKAQIEEAEKHVRAFFRGGKMPLPDPSEVEEVRQNLRQHKVYFLYYKLVVAQSTPEAFDLYYVAAEDALAAEDTPLENMLTAEMQAVVHEHPDKFKGEIYDCPFEDVNAADAAIRWLKRDVTRKGYAEASQTAGEIADVIRSYGDDLAVQELEVWQGLLQIYGGGKEVEEAKEPLQGVIDKLSSKHPSHRGKAILATALNHMGYLARVEGRFLAAKSRYEEALVLWRQTGVQTQEAYTRNNLAFVLAELGHLESSLQIAADVFELRLTGGWIPMGLSWTTMAHILIRDGGLKDALEHARWALQAFQAGDYPRGQGLAYIVAAEAERRRTEEIPETAEIEQALRQAIQYAEMGIEIFKDKVTEPSRLIEAYIEAGCDYRDLVKYQRDFTPEKMGKSAAISENCLKEAEGLAAQEGILYRQIEAMVNRAWLKYYIKQAGDALEILGDVDKLLGEYQLNEQGKITKLPAEENCISPCLALLGKSELLRGQIAFLEFEKSKKQDDLVDPARHYARALLYDQYFSTQLFRDLRRAKGRMYERFKQLNPKELQVVIDAVRGQPGGDLLVNLLKEYALYR
ncbi:MAG: tetratricopeptide repeat protein, partial [Chloroflexi bacterium]|nr:tetratricopeptide repeat protein [Chloroflexota bacterium]